MVPKARIGPFLCFYGLEDSIRSMFGHGKQGVDDGAVQLKDVLDLPVGGIVVLSHFSGHLYTFLGPELARIPDIMKLHAERTDCRVHLLVRDEHLFMKPVCDLAVWRMTPS